jgi:hypothetical protein
MMCDGENADLAFQLQEGNRVGKSFDRHSPGSDLLRYTWGWGSDSRMLLNRLEDLIDFRQKLSSKPNETSFVPLNGGAELFGCFWLQSEPFH